MAQKSNIQWTDATWNIARGCSKVDEDCKYCYMFRDSFDGTRYNPREVVRTKTVFNLPLKIKEPSKIFTCSLTDFFHESIDSYRHEAWDIIRRCPHHIFQILTKRPERVKDHLPPDWGNGWDNVWLGTSCGSQKGAIRAVQLAAIPAKVRFISAEPLWQPVEFKNIIHRICHYDDVLKPILGCTETYDVLRGERIHGRIGYDFGRIHWVIVGGESGNETGKYRYRPCDLSWIEKIVADCKEQDVPVFVKQLGTYLAKRLGMSDRHGGNIDEFPEHLRIRQFPQKR